MSGASVMTYLRRLCSTIDAGRPIERFTWRCVVTPIAGPAIVGGALLASGCSDPVPEPVQLYAAPLVEICGDGVDNDGNGHTDCADDACATDATCAAVPAYGVPPQLEVCDDKQDNNNDGLVDCQDPRCVSDPVCANPPPRPSPPAPVYGAPPVEVCTDGVDNDGDGAVDCLDTECRSQPVCSPPVDAYAAPPMDHPVQRYRAPFPR